MKYFVVMEMSKWAGINADFAGSKFPISVKDAGIGFLKVYDDESLLKKEHPGKHYIPIQEIAPGE